MAVGAREYAGNYIVIAIQACFRTQRVIDKDRMVDRNLPHAAYFQVAREPAYPGMDNPQPVGVIHAHERQHADKPAYVIVKDAVLEQGFIQTTRRDDTIRIIPLVLYFHGKAARVQITVPENQPVGVNPGVMNLEELTAAVILYILEFRQARRKRERERGSAEDRYRDYRPVERDTTIYNVEDDDIRNSDEDTIDNDL